MKKLIFLISILSITVSCTKIDTIKMAASHAVGKYCSIPSGARSVARDAMYEVIKPNSIKITCLGD